MTKHSPPSSSQRRSLVDQTGPDVSLSRRQFLAASGVAGAVTLAGCSVLGPGAPDVVVFNKRDSSVTATVTLTGSDGDEILSKQPDISENGAFEQDDVLPSEGPVTFAVDVDGGESGTNEFGVDGDDQSLQARITDDGIEFEKQG